MTTPSHPQAARSFVDRPRTTLSLRELRHLSPLRPLTALLLLTLPAWAAAQVAPPLPSAGSLLQQVQPAAPVQRANPETGLSLQRPDGQTLPASAPFEVRAITISGNTLIATDTLAALVADGVGQRLTLPQLDALATRITEAYQRAGYPLARAIVPAQTITEGRVSLQVIEARFGALRINNTSRVSDRLLAGTLAPLVPGEAIAQDRLDRALLLLADIPGVQASSVLEPGTEVGSTNMQVDVQAGPAVTGQLTLDDAGSGATGRARLNGLLSLVNPLGLGDVLSVNALTAGAGLSYGRLAYELLADGSGTRLGVSASALRYSLVGSLAALQAHGTARVLGLSLRQPLLRRGEFNLSAALTLDRTELRDHVDSSGLASDRNLRNAGLSLQGDRVDGFGGGGVTLLALGWTSGQVDFDQLPAQQADAVLAQTQGRFSKWTLNLARQQVLGQGTNLYLNLSVQRADRNLDASQKLSAGGPNGVRGYDTGVAPGDEGEVLSVEVRRNLVLPALAGQWQAIAFADTAHMTINRKPFAAGANSLSLSGAGLGLAWAAASDGLQARLSVAAPVGALPASLNLSRTTRWWLEASQRF
jgi:hemolysin activation/secretion protein